MKWVAGWKLELSRESSNREVGLSVMMQISVIICVLKFYREFFRMPCGRSSKFIHFAAAAPDSNSNFVVLLNAVGSLLLVVCRVDRRGLCLREVLGHDALVGELVLRLSQEGFLLKPLALGFEECGVGVVILEVNAVSLDVHFEAATRLNAQILVQIVVLQMDVTDEGGWVVEILDQVLVLAL